MSEGAVSVPERVALGREARRTTPRSSHRDWSPPSDRPTPVSILSRQDESRTAALVPIRHGRMLASPFAFYRGAAAVMASDLSRTARSGLEAQLCGDAHLSNFGVFEAPDRRLVFDLNDFDETLPGPFEWDVKRLAASFAVAGRDRGFGDAQRRSVILAAARAYREAMRQFAGMPDLEVWYARLDVDAYIDAWRAGLSKREIAVVEKGLAKSRRKDSRRALSRLAHRVDGVYRIISDPPLVVPIEEVVAAASPEDIERALHRLIASYRATLPHHRRVLAARYRYAHAAHKIVGVGSVGTQAWILLMLGRDDDDPLFLQAKEAQRSVLEPYAARSRFGHQGRRVVEGQLVMQAAADTFLGWVTNDESSRDFYVRQLWDGKWSPEVELMKPRGLQQYGEVCGWTLARAHARTGDRVAIGAYLGGGAVFDEAVADFAEAYADQNQRDYDAVRDAVRSGELSAWEGV